MLSVPATDCVQGLVCRCQILKKQAGIPPVGAPKSCTWHAQCAADVLL